MQNKFHSFRDRRDNKPKDSREERPNREEKRDARAERPRDDRGERKEPVREERKEPVREERRDARREEFYIPPYDAALLAESVDKLKINKELLEKLRAAKIYTYLDVAKRRERDFFRINGFNRRNLEDLKYALRAARIAFRPEERRPFPDNRGNGGQARPDPRNSRPQPNQQPQKRIFDSDGISEKRTKEEREKRRPPRPQTQYPTDSYLKVNKNGKWGFADRSGNQVISPAYDEVFSFKEDLCCVEQNEKFGYIDRKGEEVIPMIYDVASSFSEGYACVCKGGLCGYINKKNETVIDFKFDAGTPVIEGNCRVKKEGKWGELYIDNPNEIRWI